MTLLEKSVLYTVTAEDPMPFTLSRKGDFVYNPTFGSQTTRGLIDTYGS